MVWCALSVCSCLLPVNKQRSVVGRCAPEALVACGFLHKAQHAQTKMVSSHGMCAHPFVVLSTILMGRTSATTSLQSPRTGRHASSSNGNGGYRDGATAQEFGHLFTDQWIRDDGRLEDDKLRQPNNRADYLETTTRKGEASPASSSHVRMLAKPLF